jgi:PAS domain S-box-containing protein
MVKMENNKNLSDDEKHYIKKLKESEDRYKMLFDCSNDVLVQIDKKGNIVDVNKKALEIGGYKRKELVGKKISALADIFTKTSLAKMVANFAKRMLGKEVTPYEVEGKNKQGDKIFFEISAATLTNGDKKKVGEMAILHDITKRKVMEEKLKEKIKELEVINKAMVGRELKMIDMKNEILKLKKRE